MNEPVLARLGPWLAGLYGALALADEAIPGGLFATKAVGAALVLLTLFSPRVQVDSTWRSLALPLGLLASWSALSLLWSVDPASTRLRATHLSFEAVLLAALCFVPHRDRLLRGLARGAAFATVVLGVGFLSGLLDLEQARIHPFGVHANLQARDAVMGALLAAVALSPRWLAGVAALAGMALGLSSSAGAALATLVACSVLTLRNARRWRPLVAGLLLGTLLGGTALSIAATGHPRVHSPARALGGDAREEIGSGRLVVWAHAARLIAEHPALGVGAGAFPEAMERGRLSHQRAGGEHSKPRRRAHSIYLDLLAETGPVGLLLFLTLLGSLARGAWRRRDDLSLALLTFVTVSAATDSLLQQRSLWLALAAAALLPRATER